MRRKVNEKYLSKYKYVTVLAERFISGYYFLVFEVDIDREVLEELFSC
jgi:hypothetical protein